MADSTTANGAIIWYGQCVIERPGGGAAPGGTNYTTPNEAAFSALTVLPSGINPQDFILGRRAMLLMAPSGTNANRITVFPPGLPPQMMNPAPAATYGLQIPSYDTPEFQPSGTVIPCSNNLAADSAGCHITSARVAVAAQTNQMVMRKIATTPLSASQIAYAYCYRIRVLQDIYGANDGNYATNYFRMHPQLLQGCSSFGVDWTDGSYDINGNLVWYGNGNPAGGAYSSAQPAASNSDGYVACFGPFNRDKWPKALRISMRVTDRNLRLNGPRDFVHVIRIGG
jgi:hypothetical protein